jgi:lysozyme
MTALDSLIIRHEGLRLKPYRDSMGLLTIGIGRNLDQVGISNDEALYLFANDKAKVIASCRGNFEWFDKLAPVRQMVVVDMVFNLGIEGFKKFQKTLYYIRAGLYENASLEMLDSTWARQVKGRALELSAMMRTGEVPEWMR